MSGAGSIRRKFVSMLNFECFCVSAKPSLAKDPLKCVSIVINIIASTLGNSTEPNQELRIWAGQSSRAVMRGNTSLSNGAAWQLWHIWPGPGPGQRDGCSGVTRRWHQSYSISYQDNWSWFSGQGSVYLYLYYIGIGKIFGLNREFFLTTAHLKQLM